MAVTFKDIEDVIGNGSNFFSVTFQKKDGSTRNMVCRRNVQKYLAGGEMKYDPRERNLLTVWDCNAVGSHGPNDKGYRMINTSLPIFHAVTPQQQHQHAYICYR